MTWRRLWLVWGSVDQTFNYSCESAGHFATLQGESSRASSRRVKKEERIGLGWSIILEDYCANAVWSSFTGITGVFPRASVYQGWVCWIGQLEAWRNALVKERKWFVEEVFPGTYTGDISSQEDNGPPWKRDNGFWPDHSALPKCRTHQHHSCTLATGNGTNTFTKTWPE